MISRSNWANAPNRWNTSRPPAVVVSIDSRNERNPTSRLLAATLDEDEGVMLGEQEQVLVEGLRSGLVATLSRW